MFSQKSVLARLLANENISVQQGNFKTAFFDVENRVLGLPLWKEMSADVYDLLVGHEVGHALYTPSAEEIQIKGVPFAYVNVIEDIRIEKKVLSKYPGLVNNFKRGYKELVEMDIFGTKEKDINEMSFMDRLNIKAKGRDLVDVEFSEEEQPYVDMAMKVETFEDVEKVCRELVDWIGQKADDQEEQESAMTAEQMQDLIDQLKDEDQTPPQSDEGESEESDENGEESSDSSSDSEEGEGEESSDSSSDSEEGDEEGEESSSSAQDTPTTDELESDDSEKSIAGKGADGVPEGLPEVETETAQSENMETLVDSNGKVYVQGMPRAAFELLRNDYKTILAERVKHDQKMPELGYEFEENPVAFETFMAETKQVVNLMAKEFEMRKAAYRSVRARTSTKGSLDVNKLHSYKYDDQLFKQVTTLADGKNHGMIMLVDYSGSMFSRLPAVIRQTIALVQFCKRVNIPFEVYSFTSTRGNRHGEELKAASSNLTRFEYDELVLNQLFTNKMGKRDYDEALKGFYDSIMKVRYLNKYEALGSTPLNSALLACEYIVKDFRKNNPVHKLNLITLTDGHSDSASMVYGVDHDGCWGRQRQLVVPINGKNVTLDYGWGNHREQTASLLKAIAGNDITTANFFICDRRDFRSEQYAILSWDHAAQKKAKSDMTKNGVWIVENNSGYDRRFIMLDKSASMSGETEELEIESSATPAQIARAFKKHSGSKKGNRVVTQKFAELVA
tara:strand:- start:3002 stop:5200 length:2199 start_codon:yes stop_codon:yes gene_type:complete